MGPSAIGGARTPPHPDAAPRSGTVGPHRRWGLRHRRGADNIPSRPTPVGRRGDGSSALGGLVGRGRSNDARAPDPPPGGYGGRPRRQHHARGLRGPPPIESHREGRCGDVPGQPRRPGRGPRGDARRRRAGAALARRRRPARRRRGRPARRLLLRRLPALRRHRPVRAGDGADRGRRPGRPAGARHLQRLPDPLRGAPAARRADPQRSTCTSSTATSGCGSRATGTAWTSGYQAGQEIVIPVKNGEGCYVADERDPRRARGRGPGRRPLRRRQPERLAAATSPAISNEAGNVVGLMPHPEHAVEALTGPSPTASASSPRSSTCGALATTGCSRRPAVDARHASRAAPTDDRPTSRQPYADARACTGRRVRAGSARSSAAGRPQSELAMYSVMWSEHCSYKSSKVHLRQFGEKAPPSEPAARRHRRERRRGRRRRRLGGHLQGRVAQPPVLRRAAPGRGHRRRRHRPRHPGHGRPAGRGDGPAALRRGRPPGHRAGCCPAWSPASAATATASACPTSAARSSSTRATRATRWSTRSASACCRSTGCRARPAAGAGNVVVLFGAKTGRDGIGGVSVLASATFDDGGEQARPSVQVGDPFMEKLLIECCLELYDADLVVGIQDLGGAGLTCALTETAAAAGTAACDVDLDLVPLREPSMEPARDPGERVAGADAARSSTPGQPRRGSSPICAQVGRARHRDRRGHRRAGPAA